jgi:hypothetical protein
VSVRCLLLAQSGHANRRNPCPLSGVKRTPQLAAAMSANDLKPTSVGSLAASLAAHSLYERIGTFDQRIMVSVTGIVRRSLAARLVPQPSGRVRGSGVPRPPRHPHSGATPGSEQAAVGPRALVQYLKGRAK